MENPISQRNYSLEITYKNPQIQYFWQNKFMSKKKVNVTEKLSQKKVYVTYNSFYKTEMYVREIHSLENKFPSEKNISVTEIFFCLSKKFHHGHKFLSKKYLCQKLIIL